MVKAQAKAEVKKQKAWEDIRLLTESNVLQIVELISDHGSTLDEKFVQESISGQSGLQQSEKMVELTIPTNMESALRGPELINLKST